MKLAHFETLLFVILVVLIGIGTWIEWRTYKERHGS